MKNLRNIFPLLFVLLLYVSCTPEDKSLYSQPQLWYNLSESTDAAVDVFYVLPTCVWDWQTEDGTVVHYANLADSSQLEALRPSSELAESIFGQDCNFFAPYYRQITLNSWIQGDSVVSERFPQAVADVKSAFEYFLENLNNNRPFILAGFSQGGKCVVELLKGLSQEDYSRMVAAYVIGYRVTEQELEQYSGTIRPAQGSADTGVTVCYNSVESPSGISAVLSPSAICINPLNWSVTSESAVVSDSVSVSVDTLNRVLIVEGLDAQAYYIPVLDPLLPLGNYHLLELTLYEESLRDNVGRRVENFLGGAVGH